jgi:hypothetical protein
MRTRSWLIASLLLFASATALLYWGDKADKRRQEEAIVFPSQMRMPEVERARKRSGRLQMGKPGEAPPNPENFGDAFLGALPNGGGAKGLVFEASAFSDPATRSTLLGCLSDALEPKMVDFLSKNALVNKAERVGLSEEGVALGAIGEKDLAEAGATSVATDGHGKLFRLGPDALNALVWKDKVTFVSAHLDSANRVLGRLKDPGPRPPLLTDFQTFGDIYGVAAPVVLQPFLKVLPGDWADQIDKSVLSAELHVDLRNVFAISAELSCVNGELARSLAKRLGDAFTEMELDAQKSGDDALADILEQNRVVLQMSKIKVNFAFPTDRVMKLWSQCSKRQL